MSDHYPDPPTTAQTGFPLLSDAEDPEDYRDKWGEVVDDLVSRRLEEYLTGEREIPGLDVDEAVARTLSTERATIGSGGVTFTPVVSFVQLDGDQTFADNTITKIEFEEETNFGEFSDLLDPEENEVVVPAGVDYVKLTVSVAWDDITDVRMLRAAIDGDSVVPGAGTGRFEQDDVRVTQWATAWVEVSEGDAIEAEARQSSGSDIDLKDEGGTFMEVWMA